MLTNSSEKLERDKRPRTVGHTERGRTGVASVARALHVDQTPVRRRGYVAAGSGRVENWSCEVYGKETWWHGTDCHHGSCDRSKQDYDRHEQFSRSAFCSDVLEVGIHDASPTARHPRRTDHRQFSDPQDKRPRPASAVFSSPGNEFLLTVHASLNSRTVPRCHGRITHQPEDVPHGGFDPHLPCCPPLFHGSSSFEFDDRGTRRIRASHRWGCLTVWWRTAGFSSPTISVWPAHTQSCCRRDTGSIFFLDWHLGPPSRVTLYFHSWEYFASPIPTKRFHRKDFSTLLNKGKSGSSLKQSGLKAQDKWNQTRCGALSDSRVRLLVPPLYHDSGVSCVPLFLRRLSS